MSEVVGRVTQTKTNLLARNCSHRKRLVESESQRGSCQRRRRQPFVSLELNQTGRSAIPAPSITNLLVKSKQ